MIEGRDLNQESEITLQSMVLIGVVVCALALVVLSLIGLLPNDFKLS